MSQSWSLVLIAGIAVLSSLAVSALKRLGRGRVAVPAAVVEIALGMVVGPGVLAWVWDSEVLDVLAHAGLAALIFLTGFGVGTDVTAVGGNALRRAGWSWLVALALGLGAGVLLRGGRFGEGAMVGVALTTTGLGLGLGLGLGSAALPARCGRLREAAVSGAAAGVTGPVVALAVMVGGAVGASIAAVTVATVVWAMRPRGAVRAREGRGREIDGPTAVRWVVLPLAAMVWVSQVAGLDVLLGAFAIGVAARRVLGADPVLPRTIEAIGYGFLVPFLYVVTGVDIDLGALGGSLRSLALVPLFVLLFLVVRGGPVALFAPRGLRVRERAVLALDAATALPLVVVVTTLALSDDRMTPGAAAALVVAGLVSVVVFPLSAGRRDCPADEGSSGTTAEPAAPARSPYGCG